MDSTLNPQAVIEIQFLPNISWFSLLNGKHVLLEANENFQKQSARSRFTILGPQGPQLLSVPVVKPDRSDRSIGSMRINYAENWQRQHLRSICTAYGKSPYFEHLYPMLQDAYDKKPVLLLSLSMDLLSICLKFLRSPFTFELTTGYIGEYGNDTLDLRESEFKNNKSKPPFAPKPYLQMFGSEFVPDLSVIDLLFAKGADSNEWI